MVMVRPPSEPPSPPDPPSSPPQADSAVAAVNASAASAVTRREWSFICAPFLVLQLPACAGWWGGAGSEGAAFTFAAVVTGPGLTILSGCGGRGGGSASGPLTFWQFHAPGGAVE